MEDEDDDSKPSNQDTVRSMAELLSNQSEMAMEDDMDIPNILSPVKVGLKLIHRKISNRTPSGLSRV